MVKTDSVTQQTSWAAHELWNQGWGWNIRKLGELQKGCNGTQGTFQWGLWNKTYIRGKWMSHCSWTLVVSGVNAPSLWSSHYPFLGMWTIGQVEKARYVFCSARSVRSVAVWGSGRAPVWWVGVGVLWGGVVMQPKLVTRQAGLFWLSYVMSYLIFKLIFNSIFATGILMVRYIPGQGNSSISFNMLNTD